MEDRKRLQMKSGNGRHCNDVEMVKERHIGIGFCGLGLTSVLGGTSDAMGGA